MPLVWNIMRVAELLSNIVLLKKFSGSCPIMAWIQNNLSTDARTSTDDYLAFPTLWQFKILHFSREQKSQGAFQAIMDEAGKIHAPVRYQVGVSNLFEHAGTTGILREQPQNGHHVRWNHTNSQKVQVQGM